MNTPSNAIPESQLASQPVVSAGVTATRPFYWSIRRELWENRFLYIAPIAVAAVFLLVFSVASLYLPQRLKALSDAAQRQQHMSSRYELSAALIMGTAWLLGLYYSLEALYGERRDRSILFWKSLPVSDLTAVLSKLTVAMVIVPLLSFIITIATHLIMLLLSSVVLLANGMSISVVLPHPSFLKVSLQLLYHILLVHGLWYAPIYGWLLLVSAWSPRAPLVWAVLPPFVIYGIEKLAFNTEYFLAFLRERLLGPATHAAAGSAGASMEISDQLIPAHFFSEPGLWIGLAVAAIFLAGAVRLRRYRGPI